MQIHFVGVDRLVHQIVCEALKKAALETTPNEAIDVLGDALTLLDRIVSKRGME